MPPPTRTHMGAARLIPGSNVGSGPNPCRDREFERRAAPVARGDPDPPAEGSLHDEVAQIQAQAQAALGPAAAGGPGLVEDGFEVAGGQALAVVGHGHLEPRALELTGFDLDRAW